MKAYSKKQLTVAQREALKKSAINEFSKLKAKFEKKYNDRIFFIHYLALAMVLDEQLNFGEQRRAKILKACMAKVTELSEYLASNKCTYANGKEDYDVDYNLSQLEQYAKKYNIAWDESIFDDDIEECDA